MPFKDLVCCESMILISSLLFKNIFICAFPFSFHFKCVYIYIINCMICLKVHLPSSKGSCAGICDKKAFINKIKKEVGAGCQC